MIAMFRISLRNRFGIERSASATSFSNSALSTGLLRADTQAAAIAVVSRFVPV